MICAFFLRRRWIFAVGLAVVVFTAVAHILGTTSKQVISMDTQQILRVSHYFHFFLESI